ncbi:hypothetical protein D0809_06575 [Flavobacterium circumlabens]|uniref:Uncharacterized protein n=1 Tax=Flavobacterium circumlabens TaxID=2133765 RepID=A0A4Y7UG78_9FLAO|nr:hypothetical protein [Flavobacterium circumlabens]TCN59567.1 hypothetical protein EV142_102185 [Flavobacterium circumlabens]TEB44852.1 hypothetical protein D0809_06575 [Flavobacterium circumlabens]
MTKLKKYCAFAVIMAITLTACTENSMTPESQSEHLSKKSGSVLKTDIFFASSQLTGGTLLFKSGFQGGTQVSTISSNRDDIIGDDYGYDWTSTLQGSSSLFNDFYINYESGASTDRIASIVQTPNTDPAIFAKSMQFKIDNATTCYAPSPSYPNGNCKARISGELFSRTPQNTKEYYQKVKVYLPDWQYLEQSTAPVAGGWFILWEMGNDPLLYNKFKANLQIRKAISGSTGALRFYVKGENTYNNAINWSTLWEYLNTSFQVPTNKWMTIEIYMKEGDASNGRFYVTATPDGESTSVICNIYGTTYNINNTVNGFETFNPMKAYCSSEVIDAFKNNGKSLKVLFDDLEIWSNRRP